MNDLCMFCFKVKGQYEVCPFCGHVEGTPPEKAHHLMPGTVLSDHFIVGPVIGEGGFGITYRCYDSMLGVVVAIKEFYPTGLAGRRQGERELRIESGAQAARYRAHLKRFMTEAQSIARFGKAKDIVNVYDFFEENQTAYIVMEYIEGTLLKKYLSERGKTEPADAVNIIRPLISAVKKIHAEGIIHRDISPDNIFISEDLSMKVFDFGSAYFLTDTGDIKVDMVVKEGYSAPELYRPNEKPGYYSDIYSVGAILYHLITGEKPIAASEREAEDGLKSPLELGIELEANLDRTIMEALAVDPSLRIQSITKLEESLDKKRMAEYPATKAKKRKHMHIWRFGLAAAGVVVLGLAVVLGITLSKRSNPMLSESIEKGTEITIWVDDEETKQDLELVAGNDSDGSGGEFTKVGDGMDEKTAEIIQDNGNVSKVIVEVKDNLPEELEKVKDTEQMPDMFISDGVDLKKYDTVNLKDSVYDALDQSKYYFLSEKTYKQYFSSAESIPTRLDVLLYYAFDIENPKNPNHKSVYLSGEKNEGDAVEAQELFESQEEIFSIREPFMTYFTLLLNPDASKKDGTIEENAAVTNTKNKLNVEKEEVAKKSLAGPLNIYGKGMIAGMGARAFMPGYNDVDPNNKSRLKNGQIFLLTNNDRIQVRYTNCYSISAKSGKSERLACERLLWTLLGKAAQTNYGAEGDATTEMPIRKEAAESYFEYSGVPSVLLKRLENEKDCYLIRSCY